MWNWRIAFQYERRILGFRDVDNHNAISVQLGMPKPRGSELGRQLNALRRHKGGGGSKRRVPHEAGLPIGSRESITEPYRRYRCMCLDCRIARGHFTADPSYVPPPANRRMTDEARQVFAAINRKRERAYLDP
jgi:hypothetical protein